MVGVTAARTFKSQKRRIVEMFERQYLDARRAIVKRRRPPRELAPIEPVTLHQFAEIAALLARRPCGPARVAPVLAHETDQLAAARHRMLAARDTKDLTTT